MKALTRTQFRELEIIKNQLVEVASRLIDFNIKVSDTRNFDEITELRVSVNRSGCKAIDTYKAIYRAYPQYSNDHE